jgi:hypothetical protein
MSVEIRARDFCVCVCSLVGVEIGRREIGRTPPFNKFDRVMSCMGTIGIALHTRLLLISFSACQLQPLLSFWRAGGNHVTQGHGDVPHLCDQVMDHILCVRAYTHRASEGQVTQRKGPGNSQTDRECVQCECVHVSLNHSIYTYDALSSLAYISVAMQRPHEATETTITLKD